jgi:DNA primase
MNGTKLPDEISELGKEKEITLFVDGDRGGKLIIQNVTENANITYIATAPDGKEVEELVGKEILMSLRKKVLTKDFFSSFSENKRETRKSYSENKTKLKKIAAENEGSERAIILDSFLNKIKDVSVKMLSGTLNRLRDRPTAIVIDGKATNSIIMAAEDADCKVIVAKNFSSMSEKIQMLSF